MQKESYISGLALGPFVFAFRFKPTRKKKECFFLSLSLALARFLTTCTPSSMTKLRGSFSFSRLTCFRLGPKRSMTMTLYCPSFPNQRMFGMPTIGSTNQTCASALSPFLQVREKQKNRGWHAVDIPPPHTHTHNTRQQLGEGPQDHAKGMTFFPLVPRSTRRLWIKQLSITLASPLFSTQNNQKKGTILTSSSQLFVHFSFVFQLRMSNVDGLPFDGIVDSSRNVSCYMFLGCTRITIAI